MFGHAGNSTRVTTWERHPNSNVKAAEGHSEFGGWLVETVVNLLTAQL